jgi:hypothetical protein
MNGTRDDIYDAVHEGLTWDQGEGAFRVAPDSPWDDDIDGVYRNERGIWADANAVNDSFSHNLKEAGLS